MKNKNPKYKQHLSIRFKLLSITILLILCSVVIVSFLSYRKYTKDFLHQSADSTLQIVEQLSYNIDSYLDDLFRLCEAPYYNDNVMNVLEQKDGTNLEQLEKRRVIENFLAEMMITPRRDIISAYIISDQIYHGGRYYVSINENINLNRFDWYRQTETSNSPIFVPTHTEPLVTNPKFKVFSVVRRLNKISNPSRRLAVIKVDANYSGIASIADKASMGKSGGIAIVDQNEAVIYSSINNMDIGNIYNQVKDLHDNTVFRKINGGEYLLAASDIPKSGWKIIFLSSVNELNQQAKKTRDSTFLMAVICSLSSIIILLIFTQSFLRPLMEIISLTKKVRSGNLDIRFPEKRNDEIGYLASSFNSMISRINSMVEEVYESRLLQKEAQINAFYSQIRPHFLFNTLNMISLSIRCEKYELAIDNIDKLGDLLRNMTHLDNEITIKEEIGILDAYLSIQTSRYPERLEYNINIDEALCSYVIPALIFQPIVENAVIHGCERKKGKTVISISAYESGNSLIFKIEDTADGMNEEALIKLQEKLYNCNKNDMQKRFETQSGGIGLINVNRRIKIKYGEQYGITIESALFKGTIVSIYLPKNDV